MPRVQHCAAVAAALASLVVAGCGGGSSASPENGGPSPDAQGKQVQPGSGGDELSADDTARVVDAKRVLEAGCSGAGTAGYTMSPQQAVTSMLDVTRRAGPTANFEYGGSEVRATMKDVVRGEAVRIKGCNPGAAAQLQRGADALS